MEFIAEECDTLRSRGCPAAPEVRATLSARSTRSTPSTAYDHSTLRSTRSTVLRACRTRSGRARPGYPLLGLCSAMRVRVQLCARPCDHLILPVGPPHTAQEC